MRQLTCEMCGSTDLTKQDGVFVCQTCGCKYSVEEAKKMMVEGTVDIQGTVKVDTSGELEKLFQLARRAKEENNGEMAKTYYSRILEQEPENWEAMFYTLYFTATTTTLANIENNLIRITSAAGTLATILVFLEENEQTNAVKEICGKMVELVNSYMHGVHQRIQGCGADWAINSIDRFLETEQSCMMVWGNFAMTFNNLTYAKVFYREVAEAKGHKPADELRDGAIRKLQEIEPDYIPPVQEQKNSGGCYVATAVYGSYDCPQVWTLRRYRDYTLAETWYGRAFIHTYYTISPTLVKWFGNAEWFKKMWKGTLDRMVAKFQEQGLESTPYEDREW